MFSLSTSAFKVIKSLLAAKLNVSTPVASFNVLVVQFGKSNTTLTLSLIWLPVLDNNSFIIYPATVLSYENFLLFSAFFYYLNF